MLSIIVAVAERGAIGRGNELLCGISADLRRFRKITEGHTLLMGRKTFESLPAPLPNRRHIVATAGNYADGAYSDENVSLCHDLRAALIEYSARGCGEEIFVIGGGQIYKEALPYCEKIYLTRIYRAFEADTFFEIPYDEFKETAKSEKIYDERNGVYYRFVDLARR